MVRKSTLLFFAVAAVVAVVAAIPGAAAGKRICSPGHPKKAPYCATVCVVPKVVGRHLNTAKRMINAANCKVGKIKRVDLDKKCEKRHQKCKTPAAKRAKQREKGYEKGIVVVQRPRAFSGSKCRPGVGPASQCLSTKTKVNLTVEF